jgi:2-polyprenyl-3-methyl-5-hydroxy-6-metoxy-1,4-benzoquinol methylase
MINTAFSPDAAYFNHLRHELLGLARGNPLRVLDIGCATGKVLEYFKARGATYTAGVELVPEVAEQARKRGTIDLVVTGNVEGSPLPFAPESFDLVIAGHVLEHVTNPWKTLDSIVALIRPGGQLIGSLPNVRCLDVTIPLVLRGQWKYTDEGILDRTHFRFFTRDSIIELLRGANLQVDRVVGQTAANGKLNLLNKVSFGLLENHCAFTYNFSAVRAV